MKILILSCNTGEGHNASAKALQSTMLKVGIECVVEDVLSFAGESVSRIVSKLYNYSIKGNLFRNVYRIGNWVSCHIKLFKSPIYAVNKLYSSKLGRFIVDGDFDALVAVHLFAAESLTALKRKMLLDIPTLCVMTDYTCIPFIRETELDRYIIAHQDLLDEFVEKGIPKDKIVVAGIPVSITKSPQHILQSELRKEICNIFGWEPTEDNAHWYLIMGGSMGYGNIEQFVKDLAHAVDNKDRVICICGRNRELYNRITDNCTDDPQIKAIGYTNNISLLMDCCNVLLSKPGGITSTEAIIKNIPLVHTAPIPGLENKNGEFFHARNMSHYTEDSKQQIAVAKQLCEDEVLRAKMISDQSRNANHSTCDIIINTITKLVRCKSTSTQNSR